MKLSDIYSNSENKEFIGDLIKNAEKNLDKKINKFQNLNYEETQEVKYKLKEIINNFRNTEDKYNIKDEYYTDYDFVRTQDIYLTEFTLQDTKDKEYQLNFNDLKDISISRLKVINKNFYEVYDLDMDLVDYSKIEQLGYASEENFMKKCTQREEINIPIKEFKKEILTISTLQDLTQEKTFEFGEIIKDSKETKARIKQTIAKGYDAEYLEADELKQNIIADKSDRNNYLSKEQVKKLEQIINDNIEKNITCKKILEQFNKEINKDKIVTDLSEKNTNNKKIEKSFSR